jgi:hypothetical protein
MPSEPVLPHQSSMSFEPMPDKSSGPSSRVTWRKPGCSGVAGGFQDRLRRASYQGDEGNMASDLGFCVSTLPLSSPRFSADHGPNTDPFAVSRVFDHFALSRVAGSVHAGGTLTMLWAS